MSKFDIFHHKGEEHEKQIVSDRMYKHNDHHLKFCISSFQLSKQFRTYCRLEFLQVPQGLQGRGKNTYNCIIKMTTIPVK